MGLQQWRPLPITSSDGTITNECFYDPNLFLPSFFPRNKYLSNCHDLCIIDTIAVSNS